MFLWKFRCIWNIFGACKKAIFWSCHDSVSFYHPMQFHLKSYCFTFIQRGKSTPIISRGIPCNSKAILLTAVTPIQSIRLQPFLPQNVSNDISRQPKLQVWTSQVISHVSCLAWVVGGRSGLFQRCWSHLHCAPSIASPSVSCSSLSPSPFKEGKVCQS